MFRQKMRTWEIATGIDISIGISISIPIAIAITNAIAGSTIAISRVFFKPLVVVLPINYSGSFRVLGNCAFCFKNHPR